MLPVAAARYFSCVIAISYVFPVVWITSCFHGLRYKNIRRYTDIFVNSQAAMERDKHNSKSWDCGQILPIKCCDCVESTCKDIKLVKWQYRNTNTCYVPYPQPDAGHTRVTRHWYEARNKCLRLGGDLATKDITTVVTTPPEMDQEYWTTMINKKYWIGLQRDPFMKTLSGTNTFLQWFYPVP